MNLLDRILLFRRKVSDEVAISDKITLFLDRKKKHIILKVSYSGNVQYHSFDDRETDMLINAMGELRQKLGGLK